MTSTCKHILEALAIVGFTSIMTWNISHVKFGPNCIPNLFDITQHIQDRMESFEAPLARGKLVGFVIFAIGFYGMIFTPLLLLQLRERLHKQKDT